MSLKQDGTQARTAADLERKYQFGRTFAEVYGLASDAQKAAEEAKNAFDGLDQEEIFKRLTNNGQWQGLYRDPDGNVYLNASFIKSGNLDGKLIKADSISAESLHLKGLMAVHETVYLYDEDGNPLLDKDGNWETYDVIGGYIGYDSGYSSALGIGVRMRKDGNGSQLVCTESAARLSFSNHNAYGLLTSQNGVICRQNSLVFDASSVIQMRFGSGLVVRYGMTEDAFYPTSTGATLGTNNNKWNDIYAAGTSFSALVARVTELENK
jgi:hypothetical protein